jgi:hypothetical protein
VLRSRLGSGGFVVVVRATVVGGSGATVVDGVSATVLGGAVATVDAAVTEGVDTMRPSSVLGRAVDAAAITRSTPMTAKPE